MDPLKKFLGTIGSTFSTLVTPLSERFKNQIFNTNMCKFRNIAQKVSDGKNFGEK